MLRAFVSGMTKIATVKGYTAQARYYASHMIETASGDWAQTGWARIDIGLQFPAVKPVFRTADGLDVVILDGHDHLTITIHQIAPEQILATEDECYAR